MPAATSASRRRRRRLPKLAMPSPEISMSRRSAGSGAWSKSAAAASSAAPIAVSPSELSGGGAHRHRERGGAVVVGDSPPTDGDLDPVGVGPFEDRASIRRACRGGDRLDEPCGSSKARAMPSCCSMYLSLIDALRDIDGENQREGGGLSGDRAPRPAGGGRDYPADPAHSNSARMRRLAERPHGRVGRSGFCFGEGEAHSAPWRNRWSPSLCGGPAHQLTARHAGAPETANPRKRDRALVRE